VVGCEGVIGVALTVRARAGAASLGAGHLKAAPCGAPTCASGPARAFCRSVRGPRRAPTLPFAAPVAGPRPRRLSCSRCWRTAPAKRALGCGKTLSTPCCASGARQRCRCWPRRGGCGAVVGARWAPASALRSLARPDARSLPLLLVPEQLQVFASAVFAPAVSAPPPPPGPLPTLPPRPTAPSPKTRPRARPSWSLSWWPCSCTMGA
jgi:hypothetical protein